MASGPGLPNTDFLRALEERSARVVSHTKRLRFLREEIAAYVPPALAPKPAWRAHLAWAASLMLLAACVVAASRRQNRAETLAVPVSVTNLPGNLERVRPAGVSTVWLVQMRGGTEVYSNGLRIDNDFLVPAATRRYRTLIRSSLQRSEPRMLPAGIVFHTTESHMAPFEPHQSENLQRDGLAALAYAREHRLYHFVIDRFGLVHRVVAETGGANHAGFSIWADEGNVYLNLNQSFIGISFEAESGSSPHGYAASSSQVFAARVLTEMLRSKYGIPEANCVTHAQVSVNPENMRIGYHTDWGRNFPFVELGLRNGYEAPVAAISVFGFAFDASFVNSVEGWSGLLLSEEQLVSEAAGLGITPESYRRKLQRRYRQAAAALAGGVSDAESRPR
jgi:hypothetical protein